MIIHALKMWRQYLPGKRFLLISDHNGLQYLFNQPNLNAMKAIWLAMISEFDFEIRFIKCNENSVGDALSRQIDVNHIAAISSYGTDLHDRILQVGQQDFKYMELRHRLQQSIGTGTCSGIGAGIGA